MKNKELVSIDKMIKYIDKALKYTEGVDFEKFQLEELWKKFLHQF